VGVTGVPLARAVPGVQGVAIAPVVTIVTLEYDAGNAKVGVTGPVPSNAKAATVVPQLNRTVPAPAGFDGSPMVSVVQLDVTRGPATPDGKVWVNSTAAATTIDTAMTAPIATAIRVSRRSGFFQIGSFVQSLFAIW
jgi:hypothetical protein